LLPIASLFYCKKWEAELGACSSGNSISPTFVNMGISGKRGVVLQLQLLVLLILVVIAAAAVQRHYNSESTVHENLQAGTAGDRHLASHVRIYKPAAI
jgi:hypothetical protein